MPKAKKADSAPVDRQKLWDLLVATPAMKTSEIEASAGIDLLAAREVLQEWEAQGAASRTGRTRGTRWSVRAEGGMPAPVEGGAAPRKARKPRKVKAAKAAKSPKAAKVTRAKAAKGGAKRGRKPGAGRAPQAAKLDQFRDILGTIPDDVAAERTGVPARTIQYYRNKHGIPGYKGPKRRKGKASSAPRASTAPVAAASQAGRSGKGARGRKGGLPSSGRSAWRVELRNGSAVSNRYTFANSLTDAAALAAAAARSLGAEVVGLAWVGDALD